MARGKRQEVPSAGEGDETTRLLERFEFPAWVFDPETFRVLAANAAALEAYGYTHEEFLGLTLHDIRLGELPSTQLATRARHRRKDGTEVEVEEVSCPFEFGGRPAVLVLARRAERPAFEEATDWEGRFLQMAELIPDYAYAFRVEPDGQLRGEWVSRSFERVFGFTIPEIDARGGWASMVYPDDLPLAFQHARRVLEGNRDICEMRFVTRNGEVRWIRDTAVPVWDPAGKRVVWIYGAAQDITELKEAERKAREREEWFRRLADTTSTAIFVYQGERFVYVNRASEDLTGYTAEELCGMRFWEIVHPDFRDLVRERGLARQRGADVPPRYEFQIVRKDGAVRWVDSTAGRIEWHGRPAALGTAYDITERKEAQKRLEESEVRFRRLAENAPDLIYRYEFSPRRGFTYVSPAATLITGYTPEEHYADPDLGLKIVHPDDRPLLERYFAGGGVFHEPIVLRWVRKDGGVLWTEQRNVPIYDEAGNLVALEGIARDVTERVLRERELEAMAMLAQAIGETLEPQPLLERVLQAAIHAVPVAEKGSICLVDAKGRLRIRATLGYTDPALLWLSFPPESGYAARAVRERRPLLISDVRSDPVLRYNGEVEEAGTVLSAIVAPLLVQDRAIGAIALDNCSRTEAFTERDLQVLAALASTVALVVENARLFEEARRRAAQQTALNAVLVAASRAGEDVQALVEVALDHLLQALGVQMGTIWVRPQMDTCVALAIRGFSETLGLDMVQIAAANGIQLDAVQVWEDLRRPRGPVQEALHRYGVRAGLAAPLLAERGCIGGIVVAEGRPRAWSADEVALMEMLGRQLGVLVERAVSLGETRRHLAELEAVHRVSAALRGAEKTEDALAILLDETLAVLGTDLGAIGLYDRASDTIRPAVVRGWLRQLLLEPVRRGEGIVGTVAATGQVYVSADFSQDPLVSKSARTLIPPGWGGVCVPIRRAGSIFGVLLVGVPLPRQIQPEEVMVLTSLAEMAGAALHRMQLHEATERQLARVEALLAIDRAIGASLDARVALGILLEQAVSNLGVDAAGVLLLDPAYPVLECAAGVGFRTTRYEHCSVRLGEGYAGRVAQEQRLLYVRTIGVPDIPAICQELYEGEGFVSYAGVPLIAKGRVKGVLEVFHRSVLEPDESWFRFLEALAQQAAIAVDNAELFESLQRSQLELAAAYDATIEGWSQALDLRDRETEGHTRRVTELTLRVARALGVPEEEQAHIRRGALLHDIGKMGIPDAILHKPGPLSEEEWALMRKHPVFAYEMLSRIEYLRPALDIPYAHHERWDGSGYPRGLKGEEIPLAARIFAVVDVWDALTSDRPYRPAWSRENALEYIREQAGKLFDPRVVEAFLQEIASTNHSGE